MTGRVILVTDKQNLRPEIWLQAVLRLDHRQIVAGGNNAAVEHDEIGFARGEDHFLRLTAAEGAGREENARNRRARSAEETVLASKIYGC